jgi:hypothetical protein
MYVSHVVCGGSFSGIPAKQAGRVWGSAWGPHSTLVPGGGAAGIVLSKPLIGGSGHKLVRTPVLASGARASGECCITEFAVV